MANQLTLRKKIVFSAMTTIAFFLFLELILALCGVRPESETTDRFVGFSRHLPLFQLTTDAQGVETFATSESKLHWFNYQSFAKKKSAKTIRIFCMGGSTTYGHPYWDETSFAGWLRVYLPVVDPDTNWEVINAGGISYASYRVAALMEELANYEPDLFIVYSVHNEFLERRTYASMFEQSNWMMQVTGLLVKTRTWTMTDRLVSLALQRKPAANDRQSTDKRNVELLPDEVDEELNHTIGPSDYHRDDAWKRNVVAHYESNLRRMIAIARNAGAKIVFVSPASNEKNCSPFKSEHAPEFSPLESDRFQSLLTDAQMASGSGDHNLAVKLLEQARSLDPDFADMQYQLGRAYLELDQQPEALTALRRAINTDVCPLRAVDEIENAIARVTQDYSVPRVDFLKKLRAYSEQKFNTSILGEETFLDHVHPTIEVNRQLAMWIIEELQEQKTGTRAGDCQPTIRRSTRSNTPQGAV